MTVGDRVGWVGDVAVECLLPVLIRRIERELAATAKVKLALGDTMPRRPLVVGLPLVRAGLESDRFGLNSAFVFQPVGEPRRLDLLAKILARVAVEVDLA